ncbi:MAG: TspO/MBR family protein [Kofleriaceae bacterium]|nr:TspO/MBR family protein [Kofleriaceae bacterium]
MKISHDRELAAVSVERARTRSVLAGLGFALACYGVAALGTLTMRGRGSPNRWWFRSLRKPSFQPPDRVFAPVWTILYGTIAYSGWRIWKRPPSRRRSAALGLWAAQLVLNGAWTPLFFGARRPRAALVDLIALDVAASAYTASAARIDRMASLAFVPYLGWLGFATVLNAKIVAKNPNALLAT